VGRRLLWKSQLQIEDPTRAAWLSIIRRYVLESVNDVLDIVALRKPDEREATIENLSRWVADQPAEGCGARSSTSMRLCDALEWMQVSNSAMVQAWVPRAFNAEVDDGTVGGRVDALKQRDQWRTRES
jgi:hypothetical protein